MQSQSGFASDSVVLVTYGIRPSVPSSRFAISNRSCGARLRKAFGVGRATWHLIYCNELVFPELVFTDGDSFDGDSFEYGRI